MKQGLLRTRQFAIGFIVYCVEMIIAFVKFITDWFWEILFAVLLFVVIWVVMLAIFPIIDRQLHDKSACYIKPEKSMECIQERMDKCLKTEQYTKDQCVILIGGGK